MPNPEDWTAEDTADITAIEADADAMIVALDSGTYSRSSLLAMAQAIKTKALSMKARHQ